MKGEVNVYWFVATKYNPIVEDLISTKKLLDNQVIINDGDSRENLVSGAGMKLCPAITSYYDNCFTFVSPKKIRAKFLENGDLYTTLNLEHDDGLFTAVNKPSKAYSLNFSPVFIADTDTLILEQLHPTGCGGEFSKKTSVRQGHLDCAKYARPLDLVFQNHEAETSFDILENDPLMNIRFVTDKKINFIRVFPTPEILMLLQTHVGEATRFHDGRFKSLKHHYNLFKASGARKQLMKLIKEQVGAK